MISAATLGVALGVIPWSYVGDAVGRKRAMLTAIVLACLCAALIAVMPGYWWMLALRFVEKGWSVKAPKASHAGGGSWRPSRTTAPSNGAPRQSCSARPAVARTSGHRSAEACSSAARTRSARSRASTASAGPVST